MEIAEEEALIVWNPREKRQHFIRRAQFRTDVKSFGFLVPTPSVPELAEAPDALFDSLADRIRPEVRYERRRYLTIGSFTLGSREGAAIAGGVDVLASARVAGFDATVLAADSSDALADWLEARGYPLGRELRDWLTPYVKSGWKIVAFQVARDEAGKALDGFGTKAVRMSFQTDTPFFPYREPSTQRSAGSIAKRLLRIYFVGPAKVRGTLSAPDGWPGKLVWGAPFDDATARLAGANLSLTENVWLSAFEDDRAPRPGVADLFFEPDPDGSKVLPAPIVHTIDDPIVVPIELLLLVALIGAAGTAVFVSLRRRAP